MPDADCTTSQWVSNTAIVCVTAPCTTYLAGANRDLDIQVNKYLQSPVSFSDFHIQQPLIIYSY